MKANRFTEEQIVRALKEVEAGSKQAAGQQRELEVNAATWYIWKRKYGGLAIKVAKRLKRTGTGNNKLKRLVANLVLENEAVKEVLKKL
mgnify:CR=1 FL=1